MFNFFVKKENRSLSSSNVNWSYFSANKPTNYMSIGTVYACIRMISDSISMTPLKVYKKTDKGRVELDQSDFTSLLQNPYLNMTYYQWLNAMCTQLIGWGNAYSYIIFDGIIPKELIFIPTNNVSVFETSNKNEPYYYRVTLSSGEQITIYPDDMIHFRNTTLDGFNGLSPINLHAMTFDRGYYEGDFATNYMQNAGSMSGIISTDKRLKEDQVIQLKKDFGSTYGGSKNAGKTPVLADGLKYTQLKPISPADADYVSSKELTKAEIMEIFKVPPPLLGVIDATYNNTEQLALIYQRYTLSPIYTMIEQEMSLKLISSSIRSKVYMEFMSDALLNATAKDKADVITKLTEKGVFTLNEARRKYNLKDIDGLDKVVLPLSSAPMDLHEEVLKPVDPVPVDPVPVETEIENNLDNDQLRSLVHKLQSDLGRLKKDIGNGSAIKTPPATPRKK